VKLIENSDLKKTSASNMKEDTKLSREERRESPISIAENIERRPRHRPENLHQYSQLAAKGEERSEIMNARGKRRNGEMAEI